MDSSKKIIIRHYLVSITGSYNPRYRFIDDVMTNCVACKPAGNKKNKRMKNIKLLILLLLGFVSTNLLVNAQTRVIDNKGTVSTIDASKWTRIGVSNDIYAKYPGNVGIGTTTPLATLHNA